MHKSIWDYVIAVVIILVVLLALNKLNVTPILGALLAGCTGSLYLMNAKDK